MIRIVLALAALLFLAPVAQAASFDCAKAATSMEKAICGSPDLSKADETLATAYATAIGGLSSAAVDQVKAIQHNWLDYAARVCSDDAQPISGAYTADQSQCLAGAYKDRIGSLEASRMLGGYRFYPFERYLVEQDTDADSNSYNKVATKHFETVKIDGTDDLATAFNAMTEQLRADYGASTSDADTPLFVKGTDTLTSGDTTDDIDITTTVKSVTDYRITLETTQSWYGHGAAHPNYGISYAHFLVQEKRPLTATDIFKGDDWQKTLATLVTDKVKAQLGDSYFADSESDIPKFVADTSRWDFSDEGLTVQFQPYEVASYADGAVTVTIPWDQLTDILADNGQAIATY
jgi:uncharacterized protein